MNVYSKTQINEIAATLRFGKVVALPTETVYGLAAHVDSIDAIKKLDKIKQRKQDKVYSLMLASVEDIHQHAIINDVAMSIVERHLPGELTLVLPRNPHFKNDYFDNQKTIGVRVPNDHFLQKLIIESGPIIVTSANLSGEEPCMTHLDAIGCLQGIDAVVEGCAGNHPPTTVVEVAGDGVITHRKGPLTI